MDPDLFTGSSHKWPCGPKEAGVLYVKARVHGGIHPSVTSAYPGAVGIARTLEAMGRGPAECF
jgi:selenocysteine lyase/cysteine desulfurase